MKHALDQQLLGQLLGALEDDEQDALDARLERDERRVRALAAWRRRLAVLDGLCSEFEPPPGLAERTCRYVAACTRRTDAHRPRMTPEPAAPPPISAVRWPDLATVALVLLMAAAVLVPAIGHSRFQSRLAARQTALRQVGLALAQYGDHQQAPLVQFASGGRLTPKGTFALRQLGEQFSNSGPRGLCPDAWLAVQGVSLGVPSDSPLSQPAANANWLGTRRTGTDDRRQLPLTAASSPLLADAPSADMPGQTLAVHAGQGRNALFDDGHTSFLPAASGTSDRWVFSEAEATLDPPRPAAVNLVSGRW